MNLPINDDGKGNVCTCDKNDKMSLYVKSNVKKLEDLLKNQGFHIRYEKGSFHSGYCLLEKKKVVIINKFFEWKARIDALEDIVHKINIDENRLQEDERLHEFYEKVSARKTQQVKLDLEPAVG